jgi:hypothetical protein
MYHPAYGLVGSVLLRKSSQNHGLRNVDTGRGVEDPHGLIDLLLMRGTLLWHVEQRGVQC